MPVTEISEDGIGYHIDSKNMSQKSYAENQSYFEELGYYAVPHVKGFKKNTNIPKVSPGAKSPTRARGGGSGGGRGRGRNRDRAERKERPRRQYEKSAVVERYKEITD